MILLSHKLRDMADNLDLSQGPSEEDREALREAATLLDHENHAAALKYLLAENKDWLREALSLLDNKQLGVVLGMALKVLDERGDSSLPTLLRALADQVEEL